MKEKAHIITLRDSSYFLFFVCFVLYALTNCSCNKKHKSSSNISDAKKNGTFVKEYSIADVSKNIPFQVEEAWVEKEWKYKSNKDFNLKIFIKIIPDSITLINEDLFNYQAIVQDSLTQKFLSTQPNAGFYGKYVRGKPIQWKLWWDFKEKDLRNFPAKLQFDIINTENKDSLIGKISLFLR